MDTAVRELSKLFDRSLRPRLARLRDGGDRLLERHHEVETFGSIEAEDLGLTGPRAGYKPSSWAALSRVLRPGEVGPDDVFLDLGCGKGRILFLAAKLPFKRVIGVELSPELSAAARSNIERKRSELVCPDVQIVTADALDYEIPDDVTFVYLYNPFQGQVFTSVVEKLLASVDRNPRRLRIIYRAPMEHELLLATGRVRLIRRARGWRPGATWSRTQSTHVYDVTPA